MSKISRRGIVYDLTVSNYFVCLDYEVTTIKYVFSSTKYATKFIEQYNDNRKKINESLSNRFGFKIENDMLSDLVLYSKIEKRGFLLNINGDSVQCLEHIILDGKNLIIKS